MIDYFEIKKFVIKNYYNYLKNKFEKIYFKKRSMILIDIIFVSVAFNIN